MNQLTPEAAPPPSSGYKIHWTANRSLALPGIYTESQNICLMLFVIHEWEGSLVFANTTKYPSVFPRILIYLSPRPSKRCGRGRPSIHLIRVSGAKPRHKGTVPIVHGAKERKSTHLFSSNPTGTESLTPRPWLTRQCLSRTRFCVLWELPWFLQWLVFDCGTGISMKMFCGGSFYNLYGHVLPHASPRNRRAHSTIPHQ